MQWEPLGFNNNPLNTDPIQQSTLELYTGHKEDNAYCINAISERNVTIIVEGERGVGTTSFSNYIRFHAQKGKMYFTPREEVRVEAGWTLEMLLAAIIAAIVREIELFQPEKIIKTKVFQNAKAVSSRIAEVYRSFGIEALGFGANFSKEAGVVTQPQVISTPILSHHLQDLTQLIQSIGYKYGILIQLNNLDVDTIHNENALKALFNALRDYLQTDGLSWVLVGDKGLRRFIAQEVDRLDDIINYEISLSPISESEYMELIEKRVSFYRDNEKVKLPIDDQVLIYLYKITKGRLRYIFGLLSRLMNTLSIGGLNDRITLDAAKPMLTKLARERVARNELTPNEEVILSFIVKKNETTGTDTAKEIFKSKPYVSRIMSGLLKHKLIKVRKHGTTNYYTPVLDAIIAYGE